MFCSCIIYSITKIFYNVLLNFIQLKIYVFKIGPHILITRNTKISAHICSYISGHIFINRTSNIQNAPIQNHCAIYRSTYKYNKK